MPGRKAAAKGAFHHSLRHGLIFQRLHDRLDAEMLSQGQQQHDQHNPEIRLSQCRKTMPPQTEQEQIDPCHHADPGDPPEQFTRQVARQLAIRKLCKQGGGGDIANRPKSAYP